MSASVLRRRLTWVELLLLSIALFLFYLVTDRKDIGYAVGILAGLGILTLAFFRPRYGLLFAMILLFTDSTINLINALAEMAIVNDLTGVPQLIQVIWFAWGTIIIYLVLFLSYMCRELVAGRKFRPLTGIEWIMLLPLLVVLSYFPISMIYGNDFMDYMMDIIPMFIYAGIVVLGRVFHAEGNERESRYLFLDWFVIINILVLIPFWAYNLAYEPWRNGIVGIGAIRYGMGPYDFNFFLVPLLGMILVYDENLIKNRRLLYQISFFLCIARVFISMFRGAIVGTLIAVLIATCLVESSRRWKWVRSLLLFVVAITAIISVLYITTPFVRNTLKFSLFRRVSQALNEGAGAGSLRYRVLEYNEAVEEISDQPVIGYAPGALMVKHFNPKKLARVNLYLHSAYTWFVYKLGVLGAALLLTFFIGIYWTCISLLRRKLHPPDRGWVIATLAATIAMLPVIHTNNMLIRSQGAFSITLLLFGLTLIVSRYQNVPRNELPSGEGAEA